MKRAWKRFAWLVVGLLLLGGLLYAFLPQPAPVDLAAVTRGPLRVTVDEDGKTRIKDRYVISAPLAGRLARVELRPGDVVKAGRTIVASIDPVDPSLLDARARAEAEARVKAAETSKEAAAVRHRHAREAHELARANLERGKRMWTTRAISREDFDTLEHRESMALADVKAAELAIQVAAFELDVARAALVRTRRPASPGGDNDRFDLHSPIDGRVLRVFQESATVVTPGTRLLEVGDPADLEVEVDLLTQDAVKVAPGAKVLLEHWGGGQPLQGRVRLVEPAGFLKVSALGVEEQRVNVIIDLTDPPPLRARLGDGYRVEARIVLWEGADVLQVPAGALFRRGDGWAVFVAESGRARLREVRTGWSNGLETEVLAGLEEGEEVVLHPSDRVRDGVSIRPRQADAVGGRGRMGE